MSQTRPVVLKIGGSVITDKSSELSARTQVIDRLAFEIQKTGVEKLIIVHGGGSFGHPSAHRNAIKNGYKNQSQLLGFAETHHFMTMLNGLVMDALIIHSVAAVSIMPSSCIATENGRIKSFGDNAIRMLLNMGFTPVLHGDVVADEKLGFTVLSGDQLAGTLAVRFNAQRVVFGVDVDGLYYVDPKADRSAKRLEHLTLPELEKLQGNITKSAEHDVTGGMFGKIAELLPVLEHGIPVIVINAVKPNTVYKALKGEKTEGTVIEKD